MKESVDIQFEEFEEFTRNQDMTLKKYIKMTTIPTTKDNQNFRWFRTKYFRNAQKTK